MSFSASNHVLRLISWVQLVEASFQVWVLVVWCGCEMLLCFLHLEGVGTCCRHCVSIQGSESDDEDGDPEDTRSKKVGGAFMCFATPRL